MPQKELKHCVGQRVVMSFHSWFVASHLNQNDAGHPVLLELPEVKENMPAEFWAEKTAIILICMGFGLVRMKVGEK